MKLYCATTNKGKLKEFQEAAGEFIIEPLPELATITAPEETGATFLDNAVLKAVYYSRFAVEPVFADDSGLAVDALDGAPGVHSARFAGLHAGDAANNALLLERLRGVADRAAQFLCVIALADRGRVISTFTGRVRGRILEEGRGTNGFGYDPLFYYPPFDCTIAQMDAAKKHSISHRGEAMRKMFSYLRSRQA